MGMRLDGSGKTIPSGHPSMTGAGAKQRTSPGNATDEGRHDEAGDHACRTGMAGRSPSLTHSEARLLELLAAGLTNGQIAKTLNVSEKAVEYHVRHILWKLQCTNRTEAVSRAFCLSLLTTQGWPPKVFTRLQI